MTRAGKLLEQYRRMTEDSWEEEQPFTKDPFTPSRNTGAYYTTSNKSGSLTGMGSPSQTPTAPTIAKPAQPAAAPPKIAEPAATTDRIAGTISSHIAKTKAAANY